MMIEQSRDEILDGFLTRLQGIWASPIETGRFEFELKRLERLIAEHRRQEPVRAFYLLGLTATLQENAQKMRHHFQNALWHSNHDPDVRHGFGACLARMGFFFEAREQYRILYEENPGDLDLLAELIVTTLATGRIQEGVRWMGEWSRLNPTRPLEEADSIAKSGALLERFGVSDDDMERLQQQALGILERERKEIKTINFTGIPPDDPCWIQADLMVEDSEEGVEALNYKLADVCKISAPPRLAELVVFNYSSTEAKPGPVKMDHC
jgi:tetratricopeptide (TPR) repeat protein